jgi:hypothetical protein
MKNLFSRLLGNKRNSTALPIFDWFDDLTEMADLDVLRVSAQKILTVTEDANISWEQKAAWLITLEELNQARLDKLASQYVTVGNLKPDIETSINETCYSYCRQSYVAHLRTIEHTVLPNSDTQEQDLPLLLIMRAVYAAKQMIKWRMFSQSASPAKIWLQLYTLLQLAQRRHWLNTPICLFPGSPSTTFSAQLLQVLMLGQLIQQSLNRHQVEIASKVLHQWLTRAYISNVYTPEQYLFYCDISKDAPAKRMRMADLGEQYRYWELDELEKQLTVAITLTDRGEMPESLVPAHIDSVRRLNETLKILLAEWSKQQYVRQRRRETREAVSKSVKVNAGIEKVCTQVLNASRISNGLRMSLDDRLMAHTTLRDTSTLVVNSGTLDTWVITDESGKGMGMRVNKYSNILARPERLIGVADDEDPSKVVVGVIKSVRATSSNQLRVSVEILSRQPKSAQLRAAPGSEIFTSTASFVIEANYQPRSVDAGIIQGILVPGDAQNKQVYLILPKIHFQPNRDYLVTTLGTTKKLKLGKPVLSMDDWVKVALPVA